MKLLLLVVILYHKLLLLRDKNILQISKDMIFEKQRAFLGLIRHPLRPALRASRSAFEGAGSISTLCTL